MAIAFDAKGEAAGAGLLTLALTGTLTIGSLTNGILVVGLNQTNGDLTNVQLDNGSGAAFTRLGTVVNQGATRSCDVWYLLNPPSGAHGVFVTSASAVFCAAIMESWSGVDQTTPFGTRQTQNSGDPSVTVTSPTGGVVIDFLGEQFNDGAPTPAGGQTTVFIGTGITAGVQQISASFKSGSGSVTMGWTSGGGAYQAVALQPVAAAGRTLFTNAALDGLSISGPKQFNPSL